MDRDNEDARTLIRAAVCAVPCSTAEPGQRGERPPQTRRALTGAHARRLPLGCGGRSPLCPGLFPLKRRSADRLSHFVSSVRSFIEMLRACSAASRFRSLRSPLRDLDPASAHPTMGNYGAHLGSNADHDLRSDRVEPCQASNINCVLLVSAKQQCAGSKPDHLVPKVERTVYDAQRTSRRIRASNSRNPARRSLARRGHVRHGSRQAAESVALDDRASTP